MKHNKKLIKKIAIEVQSEYQMGGLADGLYLKFATDVAIKYTNAVLKSICGVMDKIKTNGTI